MMTSQSAAIAKSWARSFVTVLIAIAVYLQATGGDLISPGWLLLIGGVVAVGPVALRALDGSDPAFGRGRIPPETELGEGAED